MANQKKGENSAQNGKMDLPPTKYSSNKGSGLGLGFPSLKMVHVILEKVTGILGGGVDAKYTCLILWSDLLQDALRLWLEKGRWNYILIDRDYWD